jgi:hypothetical protein
VLQENSHARRSGTTRQQSAKADKAQELAGILGIDLPHDFVPAAPLEIMRRGKNALMRQIQDTFQTNNRKAGNLNPLAASRAEW